ncbi:MAG: hypothetical protein ACXABY_25395 [Candidatus Thorarchaeota archaeon]
MKAIQAVYTDKHGSLSIGYSAPNDTPLLGWFGNDGEYIAPAGKRFLSHSVDSVYRDEFLAVVDDWLKDSQNDSLRARGDIRWRVMSRAQGILRGEK